MTSPAHSFDDSTGYERLIGRWSRAVGSIFIEWLAPPANARWLEVGCGTGVFTELVVQKCDPASIDALDPEQTQIEHARRQPVAKRANFQVADAQTLPFDDASFDIVASALVINFIADKHRALSEMRRVARAGGVVAGYVWDFAMEHSPSGPFRNAMRAFGIDVAALPGADESTLPALHALFKQAGLIDITTRAIDVSLPYTGFDDFWQAQTTRYSPTTKLIDAMTHSERERLMQSLRDAVPSRADGTIEYFARANAIMARAPH